jgi:hypothetical protein
MLLARPVLLLTASLLAHHRRAFAPPALCAMEDAPPSAMEVCAALAGGNEDGPLPGESVASLRRLLEAPGGTFAFLSAYTIGEWADADSAPPALVSAMEAVVSEDTQRAASVSQLLVMGVVTSAVAAVEYGGRGSRAMSAAQFVGVPAREQLAQRALRRSTSLMRAMRSRRLDAPLDAECAGLEAALQRKEGARAAHPTTSLPQPPALPLPLPLTLGFPT